MSWKVGEIQSVGRQDLAGIPNEIAIGTHAIDLKRSVTGGTQVSTALESSSPAVGHEAASIPNDLPLPLFGDSTCQTASSVTSDGANRDGVARSVRCPQIAASSGFSLLRSSQEEEGRDSEGYDDR